jgi:hypothetical protein
VAAEVVRIAALNVFFAVDLGRILFNACQKGCFWVEVLVCYPFGAVLPRRVQSFAHI